MPSQNRLSRRVISSLAFVLIGIAQSASATTPSIPYAPVGTYNPVEVTFTASTTGNVVATFLGKSFALYENKVGLLDNGVLISAGFGLDNRTSSPGTTFDMGLVHKGDTLTFVRSAEAFAFATAAYLAVSLTITGLAAWVHRRWPVRTL